MLKYHIRPLPCWVLTDLQPAFYDSESGTALQQTSRVYAKLQEVLKYYNDFSMEEALWKSADKLRGSVEPAEYKHVVLSLFFLKFASDKFEEQDTAIANAINYMKDSIVTTTTNIINQAIENGDINIGIEYNPTNEALNIIVTREGD